LKQSEGFFAKHGLLLPANGQRLGVDAFSPRIDYERLAAMFYEPAPDMPPELIEGLQLVHEMARPRLVDAMIEGAKSSGLDLLLDDEATPEDIAVKLLLSDRRVLVGIQDRHEIERRRKFQYFMTDAQPIPRFEGVRLEQQRAIERRLEGFYLAWRRGPGTRVTSYCWQRPWQDAPEWWFVVQHGDMMRREEIMEKGEPGSLLLRRRRCALLRYDPIRGEMGVCCSSDRERRILLKIFGRELFGRDTFFPLEARFSLDSLPLLGRAALAWGDVPGIEDVRLTGIEIYERDDPWQRTIKMAADIFTLIERSQMQWPRRMQDITSATFAVKLWRQKRPRRLTIMPSNRVLYMRDDQSPIMERWMVARRFTSPN
jgi:hypothetical protein